MQDPAERSHQLVEIVVGDEPASWIDAGFSVVDGATVIDRVIVRLAGTAEGRGIRSLALEGINGALDGVPLHAAPPRPEATPDHPNGISEIDHLVVMTGNPDRTTDVFESAGLEARRVRRFGAAGKETRQTFFWLGDVILELVGPDTGASDDPATVWGLALTATDIDATADVLGEKITPPKPAVQPGRRIATIKTRDLGMSTALAVMSPHQAAT